MILCLVIANTNLLLLLPRLNVFLRGGEETRTYIFLFENFQDKKARKILAKLHEEELSNSDLRQFS